MAEDARRSRSPLGRQRGQDEAAGVIITVETIILHLLGEGGEQGANACQRSGGPAAGRLASRLPTPSSLHTRENGELIHWRFMLEYY